MFAYLKFRLQRQRHRLRREVRLISRWSLNYIDRHIWGKWRQLGIIRRLALGWWGLAIIMVAGTGWQTYQLLAPFGHITADPSAILSEGAVGQIKLMNPVLPESAASSDVNRLVYNGLLRYNTKGQLEPDLATSWSASADGKTYTFQLRHGIKWQDGVPFNAQDVLFTLAAIQNPDTRSPLSVSWQGITADAPDDYTVVYRLPNAYPPFVTACVQGILPRHILESTDPAALRAIDFNQKPIGTGPYQVKSYLPDQHQVLLEANSDYFGGAPKIKQVEYHWYGSGSAVRIAYAKRQILAFGGVAPGDLPEVAKLPSIKLHSYDQPVEMTLILRNTQAALKDKDVREAIALGLDREQIIAADLSNQAEPSYGPILPGQLGFSSKFGLPSVNLDRAKELMAGRKYHLNLVTRNSPADEAVAATIKSQLAKIRISVEIKAVDLTTLQQTYLRPRNYDMALTGFNLGPDPDVYAFWHSSQVTDPGLNLAVYTSSVADKALESGRINANPQVRRGKYLSFQQQFAADIPSVPLASPDYIYAASSRIVGIGGSRLVDPSDRFYGIEHWTIAAAPVR